MLLFEDQIKALCLISSVETDPVIPPVLMKHLGVEQEEVVEGLFGKVKGLDSNFRLRDMHLKDLGRW